MLRSTVVIASTALVASVASAQVTSVVNAPSAEVKSEQKIALEYQLRSKHDEFDSQYKHSLKGVFGLGFNFEVGAKTDFDEKTYFGGKYQFFRNDSGFAAAAGIQGVGEDAGVFIAADQKVENFKFTVGYMDNDDRQFYVGAQTDWMNDLKFSAEYTGSRSGELALRGQYAFFEGLSLDVRVYFPNQDGGERTHAIGLYYTKQLGDKAKH